MAVHVAALLPVFTPVMALDIVEFVFGTLPTLAEVAGVLIIAVCLVISAGVLPRKTWSQPVRATLRLRTSRGPASATQSPSATQTHAET